MNTNSNLPRVVRGRYQLLKELGKGGFGQVYLAKDTKLGTDCAIKQFISRSELFDDPRSLKKAKELFKREKEVLETLTNRG